VLDKKIVIIDYGVGNILSIKNAISFHGYTAIVTNDNKKIESASHIILPGVGAFPSAMKKLRDLNLIESILRAGNNQSYILGICLGMQLLFTSSEEFELTRGIDLIRGKIVKLDKFNSNFNSKLPNIGWKTCKKDTQKDNIKILKNISSSDEFYFVHSYGLSSYEKELNVSKSNYGNIEFPAVINYKNVYGCQFHPEKSGPQGLKLIKNFLKL
jgi:glutamine amidotransferase